MKIRHQKLASEVGKAHADHWFEAMQKPKNRGPAFRWSNFPELVSDMAASGVPFSVRDWDSLTDAIKEEIRQIAAKSAAAQAKQLLAEKPQVECT